MELAEEWDVTEDMSYYQAIDVLSSLVHTPRECRAYITLVEEVARLRRELDELRDHHLDLAACAAEGGAWTAT